LLSRIGRAWARVAMIAAVGSLGACAVSRKTAVPAGQIHAPALDATQSQLLEKYNRFAHGLQTLNAAVNMVPTAGSTYSGVIEQYHDVNGFILAVRPTMIRVIGQAPVLEKNIFDMTSDGATFHIFVPSKNQFIEGPSNLRETSAKPIENLRPQHLVEALLPTEISSEASVLFEESDSGDSRYYILTALAGEESDLRIARRIWFDRADLSLARMEIFGPGGRLDSDVQYSDWQPADEISYPREIKIARPHDDYRLDIHVTKLTLNEALGPERFQLTQPAGTKLVRLGGDSGAAQP
jgi:outer membrane lipoprotein-sorting protein